jgi:hypothetical protein
LTKKFNAYNLYKVFSGKLDSLGIDTTLDIDDGIAVCPTKNIRLLFDAGKVFKKVQY